LSVQEVLTWCRGATGIERLDAAALDAARQAVTALLESREREGARLVDVLMQRLKRLRELARDALPLVPQVVARQSAEVDYVSGATVSSDAFYYAVTQALAQAK
jgi:uncharacterized protein with FMN-binding domain